MTDRFDAIDVNAARTDTMHERRVLIFPAGTEIGLEIFAALHGCRNITLLAAGDGHSNHARFVYPEYHTISNVHADGWLEQLVELCTKLRIDYIFPAHDDVIGALSQARQHIKAVIVTSPPDACLTTRSKLATYRRLANVIPVPRIYDRASDVSVFPVFVKPDRGQGSQGAQKIDNREQLEWSLLSIPEAIICDYLPGDEYTVDCLSSASQGLLFAGARRRCRTRNGISVNTLTEDIPDIQTIARKIAEELKLRGAWFFQLKRNAIGELTLLEVAPRIAGAMAAHRVSGVNFPLLSIFEQEGIPIDIVTNRGRVELDRCLRNRYFHEIQFDTLYVDLDDTMICNAQVNADVVKLLFTCINQGKRIILITRHKQKLHRTLKKYRLAGIFDEVIHIRNGLPKSRYIKEPHAILIDDSFSERREVAQACGIPTFDSSMIEVLNEQAEALRSI